VAVGVTASVRVTVVPPRDAVSCWPEGATAVGVIVIVPTNGGDIPEMV